MGLWERIKRFFSTHTETREKHVDEKLRTHYYKSTKDKVIQDIQALLGQQSGFTISSINEEHGEIIVNVKKGKKAFMVITVIMVRPFRTAIDISVNTETILFSDFGYSRKLIYHLYGEINKRLQFVGTGLGDELTSSGNYR
ncbi:hypothetical protein J2S74_002443 [Evansella vedderi]|uniref:Cytosolic protein n=1 Tax=Evansella vedderi TaxID=38282 RepID=A0ABT9ZUY7_9BACI|nr:DUF1499 domain-containing protein [Evansella vedderi]MDQ0255061.1 hypothetical protein [Evansella vedderi]